MKIADFVNQSLKGWEIMPLFSAVRLNSGPGYHPLIEKQQRKIVMTTSAEVLETIWISIGPMYIYVQAGLFLVHKGKNLVISLNQEQSDIDSNMFLLVQSSMHGNFINGSFGYAPGLLITRDESKAEFPKEFQK